MKKYKLSVLLCLMIVLFFYQINCVKQPSDFPDRDKISLSDIEQVIDESPNIDGYAFNPQKLIRAVNILRNFSKDDVLLILQNYANKHNSFYDDGKIKIILHVLFVPNEKEKMFPGLFLFSLRDKEQGPLFPIFPLTLEEDIPFLLIGGYIYTGPGEKISERLEYFKNYFKIIEKPLSPSFNPFVVADNVLKPKRECWKNIVKDNRIPFDETTLLPRIQALRMVETVYPVLGTKKLKSFYNYINDIVWQKHIKNFSKLNVIWDPVTNDYRIK